MIVKFGRKSYDEARIYCKTKNGYLAEPDDINKLFSFVKSLKLRLASKHYLY